jgi:hypothetical protein
MDKIPFLRTSKTGALLHAVSLFESLNTTCSIHKLLFTGKERVAGRTNFRCYLRLGGTGKEGIAAQTLDRNFIILGMDSFFHDFPP